MFSRKRIRKCAVDAVRSAFEGEYDVSDNVFLDFNSSSKHLVVWIDGESVDDETADSQALVELSLMVKTSSASSSSQDELDDRMHKVFQAIDNQDFLMACGAESSVYSGYEFEYDAEDGYATGTASFIVQIYEEVSQ